MPRSFLKPTDNLLVILEEENGYPPGISIDTIAISQVCGRVSTSHLPPVISWRGKNKTEQNNGEKHLGRRPKVRLQCPLGRNISRILFSSYGIPFGDCGSYAIGSCHSLNSLPTVEEVSLVINTSKFFNIPMICCRFPLNFTLHV